MNTLDLVMNNLIIKHVAGSHAYGTATDHSDLDIRGVFSANPINILTPFYPVKEHTVTDEEDTKFYEMTHFVKLCVECNPNIVETLWIDKEDIKISTPVYDFLRHNREAFLSKKIAFTTSGYAMAQLKRIKGHNKFINSPFKNKPLQTDFISLIQNFTSSKILKFNISDYVDDHLLYAYGNDIFGVFESNGYSLYNKDSHNLNTVIDREKFKLHNKKGEPKVPKFIIRFNKDEYKFNIDKYKSYCNWKQNRNEARSKLEERFGYDTKHASHLVRLMRMGYECLNDGHLLVRRPDADELLSIRNGSWTYEQIVEYAEHMDNLIRTDLYKKSELPKNPNLFKVAKILMEAQEMVWNSQ